MTYKREWDKRPRKPDDIIRDKNTGRLMEKKGKSCKIYWTAPMLEKVRREFPYSRSADLAGILGVSSSTLCRKAKEIGVKKSDAWMEKCTKERLRLAHFTNKIYGYKTFSSEKSRRVTSERMKKSWQDPEFRRHVIEKRKETVRRKKEGKGLC